MPLRLIDTLSGRPKPVRPAPGRPVALYVCGPTVYAPSHVGHASNYIQFDLMRRTLEADGVRVRHVMNITDFEDKLVDRAEELGVTWQALARREEAGFVSDMDAIAVRRPHVQPRASDFVRPMVAVARRLERTGRVRRQGDEWLYFPPPRPRGRNFPIGAQLAAHAVREPAHPFPEKDGEAGEFMIWKRQELPKPSWASPWGRGCPGWHLECYAMAQRYLGVPVDLHGGGRDLIFPHHFSENEIALALDRQRFSRTFVHLAFVLQSGAKMAKSTGNLVSIRAALESGSAAGLRWYLIDRPYARRLPWDPADYRAAVAEAETVRRAFRDWVRPGAGGRLGVRDARLLAASVRRDLTENLRTDRALERIRRFAERVGRDASGRVARGERSGAIAALRSIEDRTGLPLL
jgi:cysteinyl-tRNA synthetase